MAELKENIQFLLKKNHLGRDHAITVRDLAVELLPIRTNDREIRMAIQELNTEGVPIFATIHPPYGFYYGVRDSEKTEYLANLGARATAILKRMRDIDRIRTENFVKKQLELFG